MPLHLLTTLATQGPGGRGRHGRAGSPPSCSSALLLAVVFLGFSLVKQLRKAQAAEDAGVYGNVADESEADSPNNASSADNGEPHPST